MRVEETKRIVCQTHSLHLSGYNANRKASEFETLKHSLKNHQVITKLN